MKTLYISDLDSTLSNKNDEVSEYTINTLNKLIAILCIIRKGTSI